MLVVTYTPSGCDTMSYPYRTVKSHAYRTAAGHWTDLLLSLDVHVVSAAK